MTITATGAVRYATPAGEFAFKAYYLVTAFNPQSEDDKPFVVAAFGSSEDGWKFIDATNDGYSYDLVKIDNLA